MAALSLDRTAAGSLHAQLASQLRAMILARRIAPGARLPSTRALAQELGIARATAVLAMEQLASEGYVAGRRGAGVYVPASLPEQVLQVAAPAPLRPRSATPGARRPVPFMPGAVDPALFPQRAWARLLQRSWREPAALLGPADPFGWPALRAAIARHLAEWRGLAADPARILVTAGTVDALDVVAAVAFRPGDAVLVEDPGYAPVRHGLVRAGLAVAPVPVDGDGFDLEAGLRLRPDARGAFLTPSRQFPLGMALPLARRLVLLDWAQARDAFVVEDDFDSEYRYAGAPLPALGGLDRHGRTIYLGSFSKVLAPALRVGFAVLPEGLVGPAHDHLRRRGPLASPLAQPALAAFLDAGDYAAHIRRTRRVYARRLAALLEALRPLDGLLEPAPAGAGLHVVAWLGPRLAGAGDRAVAAAAEAAGIVAGPLADHHAGPPGRPGLILGFSGFPEDRLQAAAVTLGRALRSPMRR